MAYKNDKSKEFSEKYKDMEKSSQAFMSEINRQKTEQKKQGGSTYKNVGEYTEAPGGGTPADDDQKGRGAMNKEFVVADSPDDPEAKAAKKKGQKVRYMQPRTEDGQFTYNSANAKGLSTKKSRGYTRPPFLRNVNLTFFEEGTVLKTQDKSRRMIGINLTPNELIDACKVYLKDKRGFAGIVGSTITKKGRWASSEKTGGGSAPEGKVGKVDTSKLSQSTQQSLADAKNNVNKGPFTTNITAKQQRINAKAKKQAQAQPQQQGKVNVSSFATKTQPQQQKQYATTSSVSGSASAKTNNQNPVTSSAISDALANALNQFKNLQQGNSNNVQKTKISQSGKGKLLQKWAKKI